MLIPDKLKKNDKVAIVAIGKKISSEEIQLAKKIYEEWGLIVEESKTIDASDNYLAGSDELRKNELQKYLDDPTIKAVFFARGGYGAVRIIDTIDFTIFKKQPKWLVGFSDVTVIHNHVNSLINIATIHGIMPVFFPTASSVAISSCKDALFNAAINYEFSSSEFGLYNNGNAMGEIVGGNLSILYSLCGSSSAINTKDKILYIEDLCEPLYHIDRMLFNLKRNNYFKNIKGLIIGSFTDIEIGNPVFRENITLVFEEHFKSLNIPIFSHFPSGHIDNNHSLILGQNVSMDVKNKTISLKSIN